MANRCVRCAAVLVAEMYSVRPVFSPGNQLIHRGSGNLQKTGLITKTTNSPESSKFALLFFLLLFFTLLNYTQVLVYFGNLDSFLMDIGLLTKYPSNLFRDLLRNVGAFPFHFSRSFSCGLRPLSPKDGTLLVLSKSFSNDDVSMG